MQNTIIRWLRSIQSNPFISLALAIVGVASLIIGIRSRKKLELSYGQSSFQIIKKGKTTIENLYLLFGEKEISDLTITKFAIWNSGNEVIDGKDIVSGKPLQITAHNNAEILDVSITEKVEETNNFVITDINKNRAEVKFEYVDKKEGVIIQVLHSGDGADLSVDCKIKGGKPVRNISEKERITSTKKRRVRGAMIVALIIEMVLATLLVLFDVMVRHNVIDKNMLDSLLYLNMPGISGDVILIIPLLFMYGSFWMLIRRTYHLKVPTKLRGYAKEEIES